MENKENNSHSAAANGNGESKCPFSGAGSKQIAG